MELLMSMPRLEVRRTGGAGGFSSSEDMVELVCIQNREGGEGEGVLLRRFRETVRSQIESEKEKNKIIYYRIFFFLHEERIFKIILVFKKGTKWRYEIV